MFYERSSLVLPLSLASSGRVGHSEQPRIAVLTQVASEVYLPIHYSFLQELAQQVTPAHPNPEPHTPSSG